jgi:SPW repeat
MLARLKIGLTVINLASAAAGLLLVVSPWLAAFTSDAIASANAVLCGFLMLSFTAAAILQVRDWRSWMNLVPGVWVLLSPWILGFATHIAAGTIHFLIGLIVSIVSWIELCTTEALCLED